MPVLVGPQQSDWLLVVRIVDHGSIDAGQELFEDGAGHQRFFRALCLTVSVWWMSLWRSVPSGFLPRSLLPVNLHLGAQHLRP